MKTILSTILSTGRVRVGPLASDDTFGMAGAFEVIGPKGSMLRIIASDGTSDICDGWEHVSVSVAKRCPNWPEMHFVKTLFWDDDEIVVQFHPPKSEYVNNHPHCLHLWRDTRNGHRLPPSILVGFKELGELAVLP